MTNDDVPGNEVLSNKMKSKTFNRNDIQNEVMLMDPDEPNFTPLDDHGLDRKFSPYQM